MGNKYSTSEYLKNVYSLLMTKLTMRQARFMRRPIYIRGRKSLTGCVGLTTGRFCRFDLEGTKHTLHIGENCELGDMTHIVAYSSVSIGNNVLIASKCFISDTNHGSYSMVPQDPPESIPRKRELRTEAVKIGNNVWIGENAVILPGAEIGSGSIIGANSVIKSVVPENVIVVGNGRIVKKWNADSGYWEKYNSD